MQIAELGEFGLIRRIEEKIPPPPEDVIIGIGDDAAAVHFPDATLALATTDMLVEGVDFDLSYVQAAEIGHKSLAVNLSDIAAMGGEARYALVSLALPPQTEVAWVDEFYAGILTLAGAYNTHIIGGDISATAGKLVINITVLGQAQAGELIRRSGAKSGDAIMLTGHLGAAAAGLGLLFKYGRVVPPQFAKLVRRQLTPVPRLAEGRIIARHGATSMIDLSDGLASDIGHICRQSGVGAEIWRDKLPILPETERAAQDIGRSLEDLAVRGGEDFELAFTVPVCKQAGLVSAFQKHGLPAPIQIGQITDPEYGLNLQAADGNIIPLTGGFDHFR